MLLLNRISVLERSLSLIPNFLKVREHLLCFFFFLYKIVKRLLLHNVLMF